MNLVCWIGKEELEQLEQGKLLFSKDCQTLFYTWNSWHFFGRKQGDGAFVLIDSLNPALDIRFETEEKHILFPVLTGTLEKKDILGIQKETDECRTCILMNTSMIDESWCRKTIARYLNSQDTVCVLAFSFFDDTKNEADWNRQYGPSGGIWYRANTDVFFPFGIKKNQVHWCNYFTDSVDVLAGKILNSNVLMLPGGAPDLMMKR